ncbi:MAG: tetratricopeptide repeat protein [Nitrosomonas sp.]
MLNHHFISYSAVDGTEFALRLCDELQSGPPAIEAWLDKRRLQAVSDWDKQLVEAIRDCGSLIFVMTADSVEDASVCKNEWMQALKYKKPILLARFDDKADPPFLLNSRQYLDFTSNFEVGLARLRKDLQNLSSPHGILKAMEYRLSDAQRDLRRAANSTETARISDEIAQLRKRIEGQKRIIDNPQAATEQTEHSIQAGLKREQQPEKPTSRLAHSKFINPPPDIAPIYFQNRHIETKLIGDFLKDPSRRLLTILGRGGTGKTAIACRLLKALENGHLPDDLGSLNVDGIVYLSAKGSHRINTSNLLADLGKLLPASKSQELDALYKDPQISTEAKLQALLAEFPQGRTVVLLDNLEDLIDPKTEEIKDAELDEALRTLLTTQPHAVKVILTTRISPRKWLLIHPERQQQVYLDQGLESPYAENILREMDTDGKVGLKQASDSLLNQARIHTRGYPRALVALYGILSADRYTTLEEVLSKPLPEHVVEVLVGEAFERLDTTSQKIMEALAIYERPVTPAAVDYLLQPFDPAINSGSVLNRLVNMQFVRKEGNRYYQHATDRTYALARIPKGEKQDTQAIHTPSPQPPYTQYTLLHRGAEYFKQARQPRETWKQLSDLTPQLNEFELRCAGEDYDSAASVLLEIDFHYLWLWGYYHLMIALHERLQGKINDVNLISPSVGNLGSAYRSIGQVQKAIDCYQEALRISREISDRGVEGVWLGNLGNSYANLGQTDLAIDHIKQALAIAREIGNRGDEGIELGRLGISYADLGQTDLAIDNFKQALAIAREIGDRRNEGASLGNLGNRYADLGQTDLAIDHLKQALAIAREIGDRSNEGLWLGNLGNRYADLGQTDLAIDNYELALIIAREIKSRFLESAWLVRIGECHSDAARYDQAILSYQQAIPITDEIGNVQSQNVSRTGLAAAHLYRDDLIAARAKSEEASSYDFPPNIHLAAALLGVIALRQNDRSAAKQSFQEALTHADKQLEATPQLYIALDNKGLALAGLVLCGEPMLLVEAIEAYRTARTINKDAGYVNSALRLFDALAIMDNNGLLNDVRKAAAG